MKFGATNSNRRLRTRMHGGGAGSVGDRRLYADQVAQRLLIARTWVTVSWRKTANLEK
jgi:hypothetical protein